jgi:hypothetical protein
MADLGGMEPWEVSPTRPDKNNYEESPTICILDAGSIFIYLL